MASFIDYEIKDNHIAILTLNRPEAMNALSKGLLKELNDRIQKINADDSIRCTIITASGEKAFCAGADLKERKGMNDEQVIEAVQYIGSTAVNIESMRMPVIAAINGAAFGGGLELALSCDIRIATNYAKLGLTETSLAIIPGAGGTQRLPRLIGSGQAKRLIFTAQPITAEEAFQLGIAEQVVSTENLLQEAVNMAQSIIKNGPIALRQAKTAINQGLQTNITTGLSIEHLCYKETITTDDQLEGLHAFKEKRNPVYQGK
ncbi:putative enoyl-CoA hydratase/isomerase YngF [Lentibacillus kapialis]|uniref:Enoyl-CoA hydratase/isomerase YngF n=1 Tax=Lentibacillus kapialis TaxID=340214 RepID=A0A917PMF5_9BACI|nr:enoyl-CoA hydratase [Lentibacillus kapialis]GGJ85016.1 putative enoyl-CoA hydratase/isomerase YngF [Lentibacillus kapialis]